MKQIIFFSCMVFIFLLSGCKAGDLIESKELHCGEGTITKGNECLINIRDNSCETEQIFVSGKCEDIVIDEPIDDANDTVPPVIQYDYESITLEYGSLEPNWYNIFTATDNSGDIVNIDIIEAIDTNYIGVYTLTILAYDSSYNSTQKEIIVEVTRTPIDTLSSYRYTEYLDIYYDLTANGKLKFWYEIKDGYIIEDVELKISIIWTNTNQQSRGTDIIVLRSEFTTDDLGYFVTVTDFSSSIMSVEGNVYFE